MHRNGFHGWNRCRWQRGHEVTLPMKNEDWIWLGETVDLQRISWPSASSELEKQTVMNEYWQQAKRHWQQWLPNRYSQLENSDQYFMSVGEQIEEQVLQISSSMEVSQAEELRPDAPPSQDESTREG